MLSDLRLRDFRCFENAALEFASGTNLFLGANGQGKTTVLEAACVLLRLQSQRTTALAPLIQIGKRSFDLRGSFDWHALEFRYTTLRRRVNFDGVEQRRLAEYLRMARVVSFANSDIELVKSSDARRRYLDFVGAQVYASYRPALRAYERALRARNALLKSPVPRSRERAAYDSLLIEHGTHLLRLRQEIAALLSPPAATAYEKISRGREKFEILFAPGASDDFANELAFSRAEEARLRQTIVGPHRDDLELRIDGMAAAQFASEGQQRSAVLALKMAQVEVFQNFGDGKAPLLLIDDIFGELDPERRNALLDHLPPNSQRLITATAMPWRSELDADVIFELRARQLVRVS